jgi:hypothetical protein
MSLTNDEKAYLKKIVKEELENFDKKKKSLFIGMSLSFLKGEHDYTHFLENLLKKLE